MMGLVLFGMVFVLLEMSLRFFGFLVYLYMFLCFSILMNLINVIEFLLMLVLMKLLKIEFVVLGMGLFLVMMRFRVLFVDKR